MAKRLLILNGLATLGVVMNHATGWGFISMFWWTDQYRAVSVPNFDQLGTASYFFLRMIEQFLAFSVPSFLFVSGFFVAFAAGRGRTADGWRLASSRILVLLVPYFLWSIVLFGASFLLGTKYSPLTYLRMLVIGGAADPYYYIPLIIQLYLLAPLIIVVAKEHWRLVLAVAACLLLVVQGLNYARDLDIETPILQQALALVPSWFFPGKLFWFVLGIVFSLHLVKIKPWLTHRRWVWLALAIILFAIGILEWELLLRFSDQTWIGYRDTAVDSLYACAFILCFIAFDRSRLPFSGPLFELGGKTYGVYLVHSLVLMLVAKTIYRVAPFVLASQALFQPLLVAFGLGIPLLLMATTNRLPARSLYRYLFG